MNETTTPRIYVASLSDYNAGTLHGVWIDATLGKDHAWAKIHKMLAESVEPIAEEWAIHDYEGFAGLGLSEWASIDNVCEVAERIEKHGPVYAGLVDYFGGLPHGIEEADSAIEERYCGDFDSLTEFAEHFVEDGYSVFVEQLPEFIRYHIDYEGVARDMEMGGDVFTIEVDHRLHVFWSR